MTKRHEYTISTTGLERWTWYVENAHGGAHLHISKWSKDGELTGGIEQHRRTPHPGRPDDAPDHPECFFLKCPCWHDGSSLAAERAIDMHKNGLLNHEMAFMFASQMLPQKEPN